MTTISPYLPAADDTGSSARQTNTANQKDSWLRQMELAQFSEMNKDATALKSTTEGQEFRASPFSTKTAAQTAFAPNAFAHADGGKNLTAESGTTQTSKVQSTQSKDGDQAESSGETSGDAGTGKKKAASTHGDGIDAGLAVNANTAVPDPMAFAAAGQSAVTGTAAGLDAATQSMAARQDIVVSAVQSALPRVLPLLSPGGTAAAATQEQSMAKQGDASQAGASTDAQFEDKPVFDKTMMHMVKDGEEVDLWIRDQSLNPAQSANLISRLAGEFAGMGLRLQDVTVNGKLTHRADGNDRNGSASDTAEAAADTDTQAIQSIHTTTGE